MGTFELMGYTKEQSEMLEKLCATSAMFGVPKEAIVAALSCNYCCIEVF